MTAKNLKIRFLFTKVWIAMTILISLYLLFIAFMEYNWYPDNQTTGINIILFSVFFMIIIIRLLKPKKSYISILFILDLILFSFASRSIYSENFLKHLFSFITSPTALVIIAIQFIDYFLRNSNFKYIKPI
jgi:hypothetical protein